MKTTPPKKNDEDDEDGGPPPEGNQLVKRLAQAVIDGAVAWWTLRQTDEAATDSVATCVIVLLKAVRAIL